jgi:hypothetical protein
MQAEQEAAQADTLGKVAGAAGKLTGKKAS